MFCPKCGTELKQQENGALYCKNCNHFYKSHQNAGPTKQTETQKPEYSEQSQNFFYEEKPIKICPVCNKKQSVNNSMCVSCGYDFISQTEYVKPPKAVNTIANTYGNAAIPATYTSKNKAYSAMCVLVTIFAILLVVAMIATAVYCTAPVTYGLEYSMEIDGGKALPALDGDTNIVIHHINITFFPNNTYIMECEENAPTALGFYYIDEFDNIQLCNKPYGISTLNIYKRNELLIKNSDYFYYWANMKSSQGLDAFLITATVIIGVAEIIFVSLLCYLASIKHRRTNR